MRIFHSTGADCQENCCGTDVGFGLQKEKIIKVGPIKRNELNEHVYERKGFGLIGATNEDGGWQDCQKR